MSEEFGPLAAAIFKQKYSLNGTETWDETARRVATTVFAASPNVDQQTVDLVEKLIRERKFLPGGRYLYATGRQYHQTQNCLLLRAGDSSEEWASLMYKATASLMSGAGIGVDYSALRGEGAELKTKGGQSTGPLALMQMVNEAGRHIMQGGARRSAIWAGLRWSHPDAMKFIAVKDWSPEQRRAKELDFNAPAPMDNTNVSIILDKDFFDKYHAGDEVAHRVYWAACERMFRTGEPGFSIDYHNPRESLRNACTEVVSEDDSDICNLGSLNLARFTSLQEFITAVTASTKFLLAGTLYSDIPYGKVGAVRLKNRRLGLGLMGIHEWLLQRGKRYEQDKELAHWLYAYKMQSAFAAQWTAEQWGISAPVATRAIAPTGTIGIIAETTTGIEPIFCVAYRRRYKGPDGKSTMYQYVIDPTAKKLLEAGVPADRIEDAYTLSEDVERRLSFQSWVQGYVDQAISSTINLPPWGSKFNNEETVRPMGELFLKYLPSLRGITCYPDGARGGQPLVRVSLETALAHEGQILIEQADICEVSGKGGSCGS